MEPLFLLIVFLVLMTIVTVVGHAIWLMCEAVARGFSDQKERPTTYPISNRTWRCKTCSSEVRTNWLFCGDCGTPKSNDLKERTLRDLASVERQLERVRSEDKLDLTTFERLTLIVNDERIRLTTPQPVTAPSQLDPEPSAADLQVIELPVGSENEKEVLPEPVPTFYSLADDELDQP